MLGALAGVGPEALYADYSVSFENLLPVFRKRGAQSEVDFLTAPEMADRRETVFADVRAVIDGLDEAAAAAILAAGGLGAGEISALRARLLD